MTTAAPHIVRADPAMRRQALLIVLLGALVGIAAIRWGLPWLEWRLNEAIAAGDLRARRMACIAVGGAICTLAILVSVSGVNMLRIGRRVITERRYPPVGLRVLRDTRVAEGSQAMGIGWLQAGLGLVILGCAAGLLAIGGYVVVVLWP